MGPSSEIKASKRPMDAPMTATGIEMELAEGKLCLFLAAPAPAGTLPWTPVLASRRVQRIGSPVLFLRVVMTRLRTLAEHDRDCILNAGSRETANSEKSGSSNCLDDVGSVSR